MGCKFWAFSFLWKVTDCEDEGAKQRQNICFGRHSGMSGQSMNVHRKAWNREEAQQGAGCIQKQSPSFIYNILNCKCYNKWSICSIMKINKAAFIHIFIYRNREQSASRCLRAKANFAKDFDCIENKNQELTKSMERKTPKTPTPSPTV